MAFGNRGTLSQLGSLVQINNALVEEVSTTNNKTGFIVVSYVNYSAAGVAFVDTLQLNVSGNTAIINLTGGRNCICDIQEGMWIDVISSSSMTRSIPPQSEAFVIVVRRGVAAVTDITTDRIISVDNNSILTGNANRINTQTRFIVTSNTVLRNRMGEPIGISDLRPGQRVRIIHANFQTASIPPQTTAFYIQII